MTSNHMTSALQNILQSQNLPSEGAIKKIVSKQLMELNTERSEYCNRHGGSVRDLDTFQDENVLLRNTVDLLEQVRARLSQQIEASKLIALESDEEMARLVSINEHMSARAGPNGYAAAIEAPKVGELVMDVDPTPA